jgi:flagellar biosynthesis/type III secretory pathway protein FliH
MPSLLHEGLLDLIRERPELVAQLLRQLLHIDLPPFTEARLADTSLTEPVPTEYRADAVVLFVDDRPVFGCIVEAQLSEDGQKHFSWPVYVVAARARYRCPFVLVVVAPDEAVARWAGRPITLGGGQAWSPLVLGPADIPVITDPAAAMAEPDLSVLSALAHARHETETALAVARAAVAALTVIPNEQQVIYFHLLKSIVSTAARKAFEMLPERYYKYLTDEERQRMQEARAQGLAQGEAEGRAKGEAEGRAKGEAEGRAKGEAEGRAEGLRLGIIRLLERRGLAVSEAVLHRLRALTEEELAALIGEAALVQSAEELLGH